MATINMISPGEIEVSLLGHIVTIGSKPSKGRRNPAGVGIQDVDTLDHAILLLKQARVAVYGPPKGSKG